MFGEETDTINGDCSSLWWRRHDIQRYLRCLCGTGSRHLAVTHFVPLNLQWYSIFHHHDTYSCPHFSTGHIYTWNSAERVGQSHIFSTLHGQVKFRSYFQTYLLQGLWVNDDTLKNCKSKIHTGAICSEETTFERLVMGSGGTYMNACTCTRV